MKYLKWVIIGALVWGGASAQVYNYFAPGCALSGTATSQTVNLGSGACIAGNLPVANLASGAGANAGSYWSGNGTWSVPPGNAVGANPTQIIGLTTLNGLATTFMRSDAAPALSQAISPTWSGNHTFTPVSGIGVTVNAVSGNAAIAANGPFYESNTNISAFTMNASGANYGQIGNVGTGTWGLGSGTSITTIGTSALTWNGSGDVVINAPSSGEALDVTGHSGAYVSRFTGASTAGSSYGPIIEAGTNSSDYTLLAYNQSASALYLAIRGDGYISMGSGPLVTLTPTGNMTIQPGSGSALTLNGVNSAYSLQIGSGTGTGTSYGEVISAGTNATDAALLVRNDTGFTNFMTIFGNGGIVVGAPTSGNEGAGTINMQGCYVNGVACATGGALPKIAYAFITTSGGNTCVVNFGSGVASCSEVVAGKPTIVFSPGFTSASSFVCTTTWANGGGAGGVGYISTFAPTLGTQGVASQATIVSGSVAFTDGGLQLSCIGS